MTTDKSSIIDFNTAARQAEDPSIVIARLNAEIEAEEMRLDAEELAESLSPEEIQRAYLKAEAAENEYLSSVLKAAIQSQKDRPGGTPPPDKENGLQTEPEAHETLKETISRLAALEPLEYEQIRKAEAKRLKIDRVGELDKAVTAARKTVTEQDDSLFVVDDPYDKPVDGRNLIIELSIIFERFSVLPDGSAITSALWVILTYCFDFWNILPILSVISPEKRCGKTTF